MATSSDAEIISRFNEMNMSDRTDMISKDIAWIPDNNGSTYNGQITFDLSNLGQSSKWLNYQEAYIEIPYIVSAKSTADLSNVITNDAITLKDGYHQLIDSLLIEVNGKSVVQVQNFTNVHTHFKMLTTSSYNDVIKNKGTNLFTMDDIGYSHEVASTTEIAGYKNMPSSLRRILTTGWDLTNAAALPTLSASEIINSGTSYYSTSGDGVNKVYFWVYMATIKLSDITDFFQKMPVVKTTDIRMTITYNSCSFNLVVGADLNLSLTSYQQLSGHCNPVMYTRTAAYTTSQIINFESNVIRTNLITTPTLALNNCRLYVPIYKINDSLSMAMISSHPTTKFEYNDIYSYNISNVAPGSFCHTLTTGIVNAQYVLVIPYPKTSLAAYCNPRDTCPGTAPPIILREFNVQLAGLNVFQQNQRYDFEVFMDELSKINAINGNNTLGLTSGVIDMNMYRRGYRMYVADLRRREPSQDNVVKSVTITGINTCDAGVNIELLCFIAYKKTFSIDTATGITKD